MTRSQKTETEQNPKLGNIKKIKEEIAKADVSMIINEFEPPLDVEAISWIRQAKNWKVMFREKHSIAFNCKPFDDQLRCYVKLDKKGNIERIEFSAE